MKTHAEYFCEGYEKGVEDSRTEINELHTGLTTLVERLTNSLDNITGGGQKGIKTALLSEANELLNEINK